MKKALSLILCVMMCVCGVFAQEATAEAPVEVEAPKADNTYTTTYWISVDFAEYLKSDALVDEGGANWAPITGAYSGIEGRVTSWAEVKVNTPGNGALTAGNNVKFQEGLEVTPVSVMTKTKISYTPIAFLNFSSGVNVGTGWDLGPFQGGMAVWTGTEYTPMMPFNSFYIEPWAEALFQFDVAALLPKEKQDWMHIVLMATYKVAYTTLSGVADGTPWKWQLSGDKFNGWNYDAYVTLGYMFPKQVKALNLAGIQAEFSGYYTDVTGGKYAGYDTAYCTVGLNPTLMFSFDKHNSLAAQCRIKARKSFATTDTTFSGVVDGTEWYFDRVALSYTYTF